MYGSQESLLFFTQRTLLPLLHYSILPPPPPLTRGGVDVGGERWGGARRGPSSISPHCMYVSLFHLLYTRTSFNLCTASSS